jgi:hypothetical protein
MRGTVVCPFCQALLQMPDEEPPGGMTCPRCDAHVPYQTPGSVEPAPLQTDSPPPGGIQGEPTDHRQGAPFGSLKCPVCRKTVEGNWLFCPHCEEPLPQERNKRQRQRREDSSSQPGADSETLITVGLVLGVICICHFVLGTVFQIGLGLIAGLRVIIGLIIFCLLATVSAANMFYRTRDDPSKRSLRRVLVGAVTLVGICVLGAGAVIVLFLVSCWDVTRPPF